MDEKKTYCLAFDYGFDLLAAPELGEFQSKEDAYAKLELVKDLYEGRDGVIYVTIVRVS